MKLSILILVVLVFASPVATQDVGSRADRILEQILEKDKGVGIMAAAYRDGKVIWSGTSGHADLEANIPMRKAHRLRIGSVSKSITAVLVLRLADQRRFRLDRSVNTHLPATLSKRFASVTPRLLGSHLAGIRHYDFSNFLEANNTRYFGKLIDSLGIYDEDLIVQPVGKRFIYSSIGYNLIGIAIESASKKSFDYVLSTELSGPLNLTNTVTDNSVLIIKNRGKFYTVGNPNPIFPWMKKGQLINTFYRDASDYYPSGGLISSAEDLARFTDRTFASKFLSNRSKIILTSPAKTSSNEMAQYTVAGERVSYSFGMEIRYKKDGSVHSYGHNGETNGAYAMIRYFPDSKVSVAAITNYNLVGQEPVFFESIEKKLSRLFVD